MRHLFELIQIGVGRGMAEDAAHGDDLAFVMEGVGEDVMEDEGRRADGRISIGEPEFGVAVEVQLAEA